MTSLPIYMTQNAPPPLACSKWMRHTVLFTYEELQELLSLLPVHFFVFATETVSLDSWSLSHADILTTYANTLHHFMSFDTIPSSSMRRSCSWMLGSSLEDFYALPSSSRRFFLKPKKPVIQIQLHHAFFSQDGMMQSMVLHPDSFSMGLHIAYPMIYEDMYAHTFHQTLKEASDITKTYRIIVSWIRTHTRPLQLTETTPTSIRIGLHAKDPKTYHLGWQKALRKQGLFS